jgi:hypothetical protein
MYNDISKGKQKRSALNVSAALSVLAYSAFERAEIK